MKRLVIMVSSYDTVCFPTSPTYRVVTSGGEHSTAVHGAHRASLLAGLTRVLAEHGVVVEDSEQADGDGCWAMIVIARAASHVVSLAGLRRMLADQGREWGVSLRVQREDLFLAMHRI